MNAILNRNSVHAHNSDQEAVSSRFSRYSLAIAAVFAILVALWIQFPHLVDPYSVEEDARSFFWWQRLQHPARFVDDPLELGVVESVAIGPMNLIVYDQSPGYSLLFQLASLLIPPILFSKLLIFPLLLVSVYYLFQIGVQLRGPRTALILCIGFVVFNLASSTATSASGGLQRSFMIPCLLAITCYLMLRRYNMAALFIFLSGTIYGPTLILGAAIYLILLFRWDNKKRRIEIAWKYLAPLAIAGLLAAVMMAPAIYDQLNLGSNLDSSATVWGRSDTAIFEDPTYQQGGRRQLFDAFPFVGRAGFATHGSTVLHAGILGILAGLTFLLRPQSIRALPAVFWAMLAASLLSFVAAWIVPVVVNSFALYLPSRYTQATIPLLLLIYVLLNLEETLPRAAVWLKLQRSKMLLISIPLAAAAALIAFSSREPDEATNPFLLVRHGKTILLVLSFILILLTVVIMRKRRSPGERAGSEAESAANLPPGKQLLAGALFLLPALIYMHAVRPSFYVASDQERQLYQFLETKPETALIAGSPCALDGIPLFAGRRVLFSCEDPHPDQELMLATLQAYYADSAQAVGGFCEAYGVDLLVVNENDFAPEAISSGKYLFEPIDSALRPTVSKRQSFALQALTAEETLFQSGNLRVADCSALAAR